MGSEASSTLRVEVGCSSRVGSAIQIASAKEMNGRMALEKARKDAPERIISSLPWFTMPIASVGLELVVGCRRLFRRASHSRPWPREAMGEVQAAQVTCSQDYVLEYAFLKRDRE